MIRRALLILAVFAGAAAAQPASSPNHFSVARHGASGGHGASANYALDLSLGGDVAQATASANFKFLGGFSAAIDAPTTGRPWLTAVLPRYANLLGGSTHTIHGTELDLGVATNVTVGGVGAVVSGRTSQQATFTMPIQNAPGWQSVAATNGGGVGHLTKGIGVLPLLETGWPIQSGRPFRVTYRGNQGDVLFLIVASAKFPVPVPIAPYHHGLELNIGALLAPLLPLAVASPTGVLDLDFPGIPLPRPIYVQMLALPSKGGTYQPGSFTNAISL